MTGMDWIPRISPFAIIAKGNWLQAALDNSRAECVVTVLATV